MQKRKTQHNNGWILPGFLLSTALVAWFYYSDPGRGNTQENTQWAPLPALWTEESLLNVPVLLVGYVPASFSTKVAGAFILEDETHDLVVLARGFTPEANRLVAVVCIPRKVVLVNDRIYLVAALIDFKYLNPEDFEKKPDFKST